MQRTPTSTRAAICSWLSIAIVACRAVPAWAQAEPALPPWHAGVAEERKQAALELFMQGRDLHRRMALGDARKKYEEALALWEHPDLRFYLGRVLKMMGMPLLAYENLRLSLRWGPASLEPGDHEAARALMKELVERELAVVEMRCDEPGAAVLLDGRPWFVGPSSARRFVTPGEHVVSARKEGYFPLVEPVVVLAGVQASGVLKLSADGIVTVRRWSAWKPWAVVGAGAGLGLAGAMLRLQADEHLEEAERQFEETCTSGCAPTTTDTTSRAATESRVATGLFIAGGATLAAGAALVFLNMPRTYRSEDQGGVELRIVPAASGAMAGLSARLSF
ncbi:tetratricopeptide repeat protein [Sorangium sp. So ce363]|uniref:tetratricopeptide repeat protein n=1 Tax=Sorangium sp. So ce363 TaxID=3133304 RepID=UPI003F641B4B